MNLEVSLYSIAIVVVHDRIDAFSAPELRGRLEQLLSEGVIRKFDRVFEMADTREAALKGF